MWVYVIDTFRYNYTCIFTVVIVWLITLYSMSGPRETGLSIPETSKAKRDLQYMAVLQNGYITREGID